MCVYSRLAFLGLAGFLIGLNAQTTRKLIDFEDQSAGTAIFNRYAGVQFPAGTVEGNPVRIVEPTLGTISGRNALRLLWVGCEFGCSDLLIQFTAKQHQVKLSTGLGQMSPAGNLAAVLRGYSDPLGTVLVSQSLPLLLGSMPTTIDNPIEVDSGAGIIQSVRLAIVASNDLELPSPFPVIIDNLEYDAPVQPFPPDTTPPRITINNPSSGQVIQGAVPGVVSITLDGIVVEAALRSVTIAVNGLPEFAASYFGTAPDVNSLSMTITSANGLVPGVNTIAVAATDFSNNSTAQSTSFTYVDKPPPPPSTVDIVPAGIQITQGIDTGPFPIRSPELHLGREFSYPQAGNLRLVQGKPVLLRIYAVALRSISSVSNVPATAIVRKAHCTTDCSFENNGLLVPSSDGKNPNLRGVAVPVAGDPAADPSNRVGDLNSSWNFLIPADWTKQDLDVFISLNDGTYYPLPNVRPIVECTSVIVGECQDNNDLTLHLSFTQVQTVIWDPVLLHVNGTFQGMPVDSIPTDSDAVSALKIVNKLYPMTAELGATRTLTVDPNSNNDDLLGEIQDHFACGASWHACGFSNHFIAGLLPTDNTYTALTKASGTSNMGNGAYWAAVPPAVFDEKNVYSGAIAHEMGHAIGFTHASCAHGEGSNFLGVFDGTNCDTYYPFPHGSIGGYGFDFDSWRVIPPGIPDDTHEHTHDFMSYGLPFWVSTYMWDITTDDSFASTVHYRDCTVLDVPIPFTSCGVDHSSSVSGLAASDRQLAPQTQRIPSLTTVALPAILVSGTLNADGTATLRPCYSGVLSGSPPDPESSPFAISVLDSKGNTIALRYITPQVKENHVGEISGDFDAFVVIPAGKSPAAIQILYQGNTVASIAAPPNSRPSVLITSPVAGEQWSAGETRRVSWITTGTTAQIRAQVEYSPDGGATSIPLARDVNASFLDVDVDGLPGGSSAQLTVRVSDGVNGAFATTEPFVVQPKPPRVAILEPANSSAFISGTFVNLSGTASDLQEPIPDSALVWTSDISGKLGTGRQLAVRLVPGRHVLTLSAKDSLGLTAIATAQVVMVDLADLNVDGAVDCSDLQIVRRSFGRRSGQPGFDERADVNKDDIVDVFDLAFIAQRLPSGTACH